MLLGYGDLGVLPSPLDVFALFQSCGHSKQTNNSPSYLIPKWNKTNAQRTQPDPKEPTVHALKLLANVHAAEKIISKQSSEMTFTIQIVPEWGLMGEASLQTLFTSSLTSVLSQYHCADTSQQGLLCDTFTKSHAIVRISGEGEQGWEKAFHLHTSPQGYSGFTA